MMENHKDSVATADQGPKARVKGKVKVTRTGPVAAPAEKEVGLQQDLRGVTTGATTTTSQKDLPISQQEPSEGRHHLAELAR